MNTKKKNIVNSFYENKWFKLLLSFCFFGWLLYLTYNPFKIEKDELIELKVITKEKWESGGTRDPFKIYFKTKEYSNRFGIYVGGTFGRWTEVTKSLEDNNRNTIKIHKSRISELNIEKEVIPIYYLSNSKYGLIFNENDFNEGEKSSDNRYLILFIILFIISLWNILKN
ncbi:MAG: hypothetical protein ACOVOQ_17475 [Flavobacterium sp.]